MSTRIFRFLAYPYFFLFSWNVVGVFAQSQASPPVRYRVVTASDRHLFEQAGKLAVPADIAYLVRLSSPANAILAISSDGAFYLLQKGGNGPWKTEELACDYPARKQLRPARGDFAALFPHTVLLYDNSAQSDVLGEIRAGPAGNSLAIRAVRGDDALPEALRTSSNILGVFNLTGNDQLQVLRVEAYVTKSTTDPRPSTTEYWTEPVNPGPTSDNASKQLFAQFSGHVEKDLVVAGDFNGDGRTDILSYRGPGLRWWIAFSNASYGIESAVAGLPVLRSTPTPMVSVDFDGDTVDDIGLFDAQTHSLQFYRANFSVGLAGVSLLRARDGAVLAQSDTTGFFTGALEADKDAGALKPQKDGFEFIETSKRSVDPDRSEETSVRYFGLPTKTAARAAGLPVGQPVRLGPDANGPYVCLGYNPTSPQKWGAPYGRCPDGYAFYSSLEHPGRVEGPEYAFASGTCCRLPARDILRADQVTASAACPDGYVAVGSTGTLIADRNNALICQQINSDRYQLSEQRAGLYRGLGASLRAYGKVLADEDIPEAIRPGVLRLSEGKMAIDGCVGDPPGSLLTAKAKRCSNQRYRQLQYRGLSGDPPAGTPVQMFPICRSISGSLDPTAGCLP